VFRDAACRAVQSEQGPDVRHADYATIQFLPVPLDTVCELAVLGSGRQAGEEGQEPVGEGCLGRSSEFAKGTLHAGAHPRRHRVGKALNRWILRQLGDEGLDVDPDLDLLLPAEDGSEDAQAAEECEATEHPGHDSISGLTAPGAIHM